MDKRKKYIMVIDTETANGIVTDDKLDLSQSLVYDVGYAIIDKKGNIYKTASFVNADIFLDYKEMMKSAYYADKIPMYWEDIKTGKRQLVSFRTIWRNVLKDIKDYNVTAVSAHNASFDVRALNNTVRYLTKSDIRFFFPRKVEIWDTLKMAHDVLGKSKAYTSYCDRMGYKTKHKSPQNRLTAEILYRYLSGNEEFIESHTGLEDVLIESEILTYCLNSHKKMRKKLWA